MIVMGLDTALQRCSVAILDGDRVIADQAAELERGHAERLAPMAKAALAEAGIDLGDLNRVGVVVGPGGFTGVRVGLSFARGLGIGTGLEVVGVTSLAALSLNVPSSNGAGAPAEALIGAVIDARGGQVYAGLYRESGAVVAAPFVESPEAAAKMLAEHAAGKPVQLAGSGATLVAAFPGQWIVDDLPQQIDSKNVALLAGRGPRPDGPPAPVYLRPPDAKPPSPSRFQNLSTQ